jgi:hypothetical protein
MTDFGYPPEYTVGHGSTETPRNAIDAVTVQIAKDIGLKHVEFGETTYITQNGSAFLPPEMPFLPIEQLPEAWKDGREVFMKDEPNDEYYIARFRHRQSRGRFLETLSGKFWERKGDYGVVIVTPTHFCPIPLTKDTN